MMQQEEEQIIPPPKRNSGYTPMSDNGIIPPPRKIAEDIEILSEKQSRQKGLYPEEGYEGMVAFKPKPKQQHEDIREYIPRLKEVFHKVKDKNKFLEQLYAGHEFKKGTPEELKSALDETIDFTAPREFNSYESKRAKEKVFQSLSEKIDKLNYKGDEYSKDAVKVMIEGMINKNEFNLTEKEKRDVRSSLLDHIKQKPIENQAKRNADRAFTDKYGQSPDEVFDIEKTVIRERDNVIQEAKEWGKSEQTKNNSIAYSEIGRIRVQAEAQTAQYKNQLQEKIANGLINEDEASRELHNFNLQKQTEYNDALKQIQTRYIQRFNEINKGIQQKAESNFEERLKGVDESVREKAKEYSKIYGKEYEDFARKMGEVDEAVFRKLPMQTIIGSKIYSGVFNTLSTIGGALTRAGADNAGDNITQVANDQLRELNLPQLTRESVLDPKFWAATISESMPFTVATMIPAIATGGTSALLTGLGARAIGAGAVTAATAGQLTGAVVGGLTGWYLESKLEAGGAYLDALKRGETESEALEKAKYVDDWNNANIALSIAEMMPVFRVGKLTKFKPLKAITKITETVPFGMAAKGAQEFYQGYGQGKAVDRELTLGEYASTEDAFVSTVSGALMGVGFGIAGKFMEKSPNAAPKIIAKMVQEGSPVSAAIEAATLNEAISDEMKQALDQITQSAETANERFNDIADPVLKSAAVSLSAEIKQLEGRLRGDAVDESVNAQIKEKQKQLSEIQNGTAQVIGVYIDSEIPMITTEKEVMEMAKDPEFADAFFNGKVKVDFRNVDNKQFLETIQQTYDTQNQKGVQGGERTGQEPVEGQPDQSTGTKTSETNRIFSEQEKEIEAKFSNVVSEIAASVSGKIDAVEQKAGRGEIIDSKEIESAINGLYDMLDKIDNSDLRPSEKQQASVIIESKINKLENYERTSVSKSYGITQESAGKTSRQVKPILKEIEGKPITFNREEAVIEERNGEYIIASKSGETNIGEVQINNRDIRLDETKGDYGITFDNTGNVESVNLIDRNGNEIQLKGDAALDVAIKLRMQEVGFIPDNVFEREYDAIMAEERLANQREKSKTDKSAATKERSASLVEEQKPVTEDKTAEQPEETPNVEDWSKDVESNEIKSLKSRRAELTDEIKKTQKTITDKPQRDKIVSDLTKQVIDINQKIGDLEKKISSAQEADRKQYDIFSQINESVSKNEITHEQVRNFEERTAEQAKQSESIIKDIESTAKNTQRASTKELQAAEKQSEELINEITEAPPIGYSKPIEESEGAKPDGLKKFVSDEKSKAIAEGFESLTHKINTIRKVNNITDERKNIQDFTEEEINKAIASKKAASKPIQERLKPIQERSKPIQEQLEDAKKELKEAWNNLKNPGFMYNPKAEAEKHLDFDKKLLKFAILAIKKYGGDLAKATTFTFNQLKNLAGIIGLKDEGQLSELMNDAISEYSSLPSDKKDLATTKEKNELKAFISGIATGLKQAKKTHKQAQEEIREYIKTNLDGKFSNAAIRQMLSSVGKIVNEETYNQQLPVIQKLIDSARYARLVEDVANLKSKSKRHEKPILMQRMRAINPLALDEADLIQYKAALEAANQKVPSYRLAENIIANLETKNEAYQAQFANKEKTIDDLNKSLDELDKDIDSVDAYRNFLNHLRSFTRTANILLKEGKITQAEYDGFMSSVYDADGVLLTKLHDKINKFRSELADEILSTDISGYAPTEAEAPFFKELNSLRKDLLMKVSPITLSEILEVKQRIATEGFAPMEQMIDGVTRALSDINSKKLTKQFESTTLKERSVEYIRMLLGMKEKAFWTRLLGVTGTALYDTFINPMARAVEQQKRIMDEMYSEMFKKLDTAGFLSGNTRDKLKMKYKVAMFFHYMGERGLRGSTDPKTKVGKDRIGFRDIFGGLMGNEKEREDYTDAQKKRADEQWDLYSVYDREIIKEIYDELLSKYKTPDGRMDLDKMESDFYSTLNEKEKALYDIHKSITDKLSDYQRVANASTKTEFIPVEGYIMRQNKDTSYKGKDVFDFVLGGLSKPSVESGSGKERATNDPMAVNLDLKELLIRGIQMTATHYALGFANNLTAETINKSNVRADIKQALRDAKNNMLQFEYKYSISNKILNNIVNSAAYISLVSLPRTVAEAFVTPISTFLTLIDSAGGVDSIASNYDRKKTKEIMEQTNSTLLDKLKLKGEKHFEIESARELKRVGKLKQLGHASVSISEAIAMPLWYAMFRTEFTRLTGVDYNTITDNTKYWQEVKEAASYADLEMKQITGGGIKSEGREYVQISPVPIIPAFKLKILNKKYGLTKDVSLSVRRETPLGKMFGFLQEYPFRDTERLFNSIRNFGNAPTRESMRITGSLINMVGYGIASAFTRVLWQWLFANASGDDERKDELETAMLEMLLPKYYIENAIGNMLQTGGTRMSGFGRIASITLASMLYNMTEDEEQKKTIADFVEKEYYSPVIGGGNTRYVKNEIDESSTKIQSTSDFILNIHPITKYLAETFKELTDRHVGMENVDDAVSEIAYKIQHGYDVDPRDAEFVILYNNLLNVINTALVTKGVQVPEIRTMRREMKKIVKNSELIEHFDSLKE